MVFPHLSLTINQFIIQSKFWVLENEGFRGKLVPNKILGFQHGPMFVQVIYLTAMAELAAETLWKQTLTSVETREMCLFI